MTTDDGILLGYERQAPDQTQIVGGTFTFEPYGIGIAKGNTTLLGAVNAALRQIGRDGSYAKLFKTDLGRPLPPDFKSWYALSAQTAAQRFVAENAAK
jgi:ABC-type amino acid transport substrate-binding protein